MSISLSQLRIHSKKKSCYVYVSTTSYYMHISSCQIKEYFFWFLQQMFFSDLATRVGYMIARFQYESVYLRIRHPMVCRHFVLLHLYIRIVLRMNVIIPVLIFFFFDLMAVLIVGSILTLP